MTNSGLELKQDVELPKLKDLPIVVIHVGKVVQKEAQPEYMKIISGPTNEELVGKYRLW